MGKPFNNEDYLSPLDKEKLNFLNNTSKIMPNGMTKQAQPSNIEAIMNIRLYSSLKDKMQS